MSKPVRVALIAFDAFTDLDLFLPWDLLNRVGIKGVGQHPDWQVKILGSAPQHTSISGLTIPTAGQYEAARTADAVLFVSGPGVNQLLKDDDLAARFALDPERQLIGAMCSGSLLLGHLGLLRGQRATTYYTRREQLAQYGAEFVDEAFVQSGNLATAAGCLAGIDMSRWLIEQLAGYERAERVLRAVRPNGL